MIRPNKRRCWVFVIAIAGLLAVLGWVFSPPQLRRGASACLYPPYKGPPVDTRNTAADRCSAVDLVAAGLVAVPVFRDLRSGRAVMMRTPIDRPLRKSRNEAT